LTKQGSVRTYLPQTPVVPFKSNHFAIHSPVDYLIETVATTQIMVSFQTSGERAVAFSRPHLDQTFAIVENIQ